MYAIIQIGSSQFKVAQGDMISVNRKNSEIGKSVRIEQVLLFAKGSDVRIGRPFVEDVKVTAKVIAHDLGCKLTAFTYRKRKNSAKKIGHRQKLTTLNITKIAA